MPPTFKQIAVSIPSGSKGVLELSSSIDTPMLELLLKALLGGLYALELCQDESAKEQYTVRYISGIIGLAEAASRGVYVINSLNPNTPSHIVDKLLLSLRDEKRGQNG